MNWPSLSPLAWCSAGAILAYAGLLAWRARSAIAYLRAERDGLSSAKSAGELTVLQPIVSGDPTLERCLRASAELTTSGVQFIWLLDEGDGEAARIAGDLDRPGITIQSVPPAAPGRNPKVDKLVRALDAVDTEFIAVLDDDTTVGARHVHRALQVLHSDECRGGLYTGLPTYRAEPTSLGGNLLAAFVNSSSALTYLAPAHAGPPVTLNGMFYATRTDVLRALGGFAVIADQLCDDVALARLYRDAQRPIHQGAMAQVLYTGPLSVGRYFQRMHRWFLFARVLLRTLEPSLRRRLTLTLGAPPVLLWLSLAGALTSRPLAVALAVLVLGRFWTLSALIAATREAEKDGGQGAEIFPISSLVTELLQPVHFLHAILVPEIRWRTHRMRVREDGGFDTLQP